MEGIRNLAATAPLRPPSAAHMIVRSAKNATRSTALSSDVISLHVRPEDALLPRNLLDQVATRPSSAFASIGRTAVIEARKGLSRVITITDRDDIVLFSSQLRASDCAAVEQQYSLEDDVPCFAISYVQQSCPIGRYKFSEQQWKNLEAVLGALVDSGVSKLRLWLDQCLWLRDASQGSWAHTGILPYVMWPVISLGIKLLGSDRTADTYVRMWPFVEEVAGLWSMGVITAQEMRDKHGQHGARESLQYGLRQALQPEVSLALVLVNIYHGAVDRLETGWTEDVKELKEMARWNRNCAADKVIVGSDWQVRCAAHDALQASVVVQRLALPFWDKNLGGYNLYIDGSRTVEMDSWTGLREFMSGNGEALESTSLEKEKLEHGMKKVNVMTDNEEFQLLGIGGVRKKVWLIVAMSGVSSHFKRGRVAWTKVMCGKSSCRVNTAVDDGNLMVLQQILGEQLERTVNVKSALVMNLPIEWV